MDSALGYDFEGPTGTGLSWKWRDRGTWRSSSCLSGEYRTHGSVRPGWQSAIAADVTNGDLWRDEAAVNCFQ